MRLKYLVWTGLVAIAVACDKQELALTAEEQLASDLAAIDQYLSDNGITAVQHPSGLRYVILAEGTGDKITSANCVRITDETRVLGEEVPFDNRQAYGIGLVRIPLLGVQIGLKQIAKGGVMTMYIPSRLAYGPNAYRISNSYTLPGNSILRYDVEVLNLTEYNSAGQYCYPWP